MASSTIPLSGRVLRDLRSFIAAETPWRVVRDMPTPVEGENGNVESFVRARHALDRDPH